MKQKTDAIVLRDYKIEDDRILTLLTRDQGVLTAYAGGANRIRSALAGSTELLCYSDFVLFKSRERYSVDNADAIRTFFGLRSDVESLSLAAYFAELTAEVAGKEEAESFLRLLLNTLHYLEKALRPREQLKPLYELRVLTLAGYMPNLVACRECASYEGEGMRFYPQHGDLLCGSCAAGHEVGGILLPASVLAAMRHIIYCPPEKLYSFTLAAENMKRLGDIVERYLQYQLEKTFSTLEFYRGIVQ